jgi:lipopolysaccharide export LptBFGC system permease protein LptF
MEEDYDHNGAGDPAQAFDALRAEVAALRQAVEAAAERQAPDYSPDLGRITQAVNSVIEGLEAIEAHPAVRMTPDQFGQAMTRTGRELMNEVAQKYDRARQDAERERRHLAEMIGTLRGKRSQTFWLIALPVMVFAFTLLASPVLLGMLPFGLNKSAASIVLGKP